MTVRGGVALTLALAAGAAVGVAQRPASGSASVARAAAASRPYATGLRTITIVEHRRLRLPGGASAPRTLVTVVRYPAVGRASAGEHRGARPLPGPFPLVVFGHGFAVTPHPYAALLRAWARAGYVVAAPIFPLGNANAPGGPNESDIVNQPGDMSAVITHLIAASRSPTGPFHGVINPHEIAVAGQSDGGITALAAGYAQRYRDSRVRAAVILSGAELPGLGPFSFAPGSSPLLASQGTADPINNPANTYRFFNQASPPKYLLKLLGAAHLPPYTTQQPQLGIVERVTTDFLDRYLGHRPGALRRLRHDGSVAGLAALTADP
jgi:dienelactone hydrolase